MLAFGHLKKAGLIRMTVGNVPPAVYAKLNDTGIQRVGPLELPWGLRAPPRCITEPARLK